MDGPGSTRGVGGLDALISDLTHFGVKGMRWGVTRANKPRIATKVVTTTGPGGKIKTSGGKNLRPASDAVSAARLRQRAKKSSVRSLSNAELKSLINRMQLEKQYSDLRGDANLFRRGTKIVRELLGAGQLAKTVVTEVKNVKK